MIPNSTYWEAKVPADAIGYAENGKEGLTTNSKFGFLLFYPCIYMGGEENK
jgi:hypothetical protein